MIRFEVRCGDGSLANYIYAESYHGAVKQLARARKTPGDYWHGWHRRLFVVEESARRVAR